MQAFSLHPRPSIITLCCLLIAACVGCSSPEPGEFVPLTELCDVKHDPKIQGGSEHLKRVTIEGYLDLPPGFFLMCSDTCGMVIKATPDAKDGVRINLRVGGGKNRMAKLPKKYTPADLKVTTNSGKEVGVGAKLRVTGGRLGTGGGNDCPIYNVDLIEDA